MSRAGFADKSHLMRQVTEPRAATAVGVAAAMRVATMLSTCASRRVRPRQVEKYADIYTSRVSNLLVYTPYKHFLCPRQSLAHDEAVVQQWQA